DLSGGAVAEEIDHVSLAEERGSTGTLLLKDTTTEFTAQSIIVGNDGTGRFELQQEALGTLEEMLIGNRSNGTGVVLVDQGAGLSVQDLTLGVDGMGTLTVTGMTQQIPSEVGVGNYGFVGVKGEGAMTVEGGARFTGSSSVPLVLGLQTSGKGTLEVTGSGSTLDTFSTLTVGAQGEGTFTVGSGGVAQNIQTLRIAEKGEGAVDVTGSGSKLEAGVIEMGVDAQSGSATLTVQQQGWVEADALNMGVAPTLALADETSISDGTVKIKVGFIGREGRARVRVENGGLLEMVPGNGILALGFDSQGSGTLEVDGLTSKVSANDIYVGVDGDGTVRITGGADLVARDLGIPLLGGAGEIFIDGAASLLLANHVYLGSLSTNSLGLLKLTNGGHASMQLLRVGALGTVDATGGTLQVGQQTGPVASGKTDQQDAVITTDTLFVAAGATLRADTLLFHPGGVLGGTYAWSFDITNYGTISPGDSTAGIGTFSVEANYTQTDTGILEIDLSGPAPGTEHDQLAVSSTATLAGTLRLHVAAGSSLEPGDRFEVVTAGALTGQFDEVESERAEVIVHYSETSAMVEVLTVVSVEHAPSADPEIEKEQGDAVPEAFVLEQNYPNPFNPQTTIAYQLPASQLVRLVVYDGLGREVERLVNQQQAAGRHEVVFEAAALPSGVYFYRLEAGTFRQTRRLILNK
ncbi:MAG TPA: T9SS type A sorting domain-containing protein, partial [Rhodothermales bacterium]|nr:T9SS type A sorting domain-containing protein [Rhodothermales bacterium]